MKPERDTTRIVRSWLEHGVTDLPDRVLDPVLDQLSAIPQRRHSWQARRSARMNDFLKVALVAAAVVVAVAGFAVLSRSSLPGVGGAPTATSTTAPSLAPSVSPIPPLPVSGVLEPGRYRINNLTIEVPEGWGSQGSDILSKTRARAEEATLFAVWPISGTFVDPCTDHTLVQPTPGPGNDELADALANQPGTDAPRPTSVTVDGFPAKRVEVTVTADIDACLPSGEGFWLWAAPDGDRRYVREPTS